MNIAVIKKGERQRLKAFLEDNIPFYELKKAGFFGKGIRKTDYEKIAARVCNSLGYKSIYEYRKLCDCIECQIGFVKSWHPCGTENGIEFKPMKVDLPEMLTAKKWLN